MATPLVPIEWDFNQQEADTGNDTSRLQELVIEGNRQLHSFRDSEDPDITNLNAAIALYEEAISLCLANPDGRGIQSARLISALGDCLSNRFFHAHNVLDVSAAIQHYAHAIDHFPRDDYHSLITREFDLARSYTVRYRQMAIPSDLEEAMEYYSSVCDLIDCLDPDVEPSAPFLDAMDARLSRTGDAGDIVEAMTALRAFVEHVSNPWRNHQSMSHLKRCIEMEKILLSFCPKGHEEYGECLYQLANSMDFKFKSTGDSSDIRQAVLYREMALAARPDGHPRHIDSLHLLSIEYLSRFRLLLDPKDIDRSVHCAQEAMELLDEYDYRYPPNLRNLSITLYCRFRSTGRATDLDSCIESEEKILTFTPPGHYRRIEALENLALSLWSRFERGGNMSDIDRCISLESEILGMRHGMASGRLGALGDLAKSLYSRFRRSSDIQDLDRAITLQKESLEITDDDDDLKEREDIKFDLARSLHDRFEKCRQHSDLVEAIQHYRDVLELRPSGHPSRSKTQRLLALSLSAQIQDSRGYSVGDDDSDPSDVIDLLKQASADKSCPTLDRLEAAHHWASEARLHSSESEMEAYAETLRLLDIAVAQGHSLEKQYVNLSSDRTINAARGVAVIAAAKALSSERTTLAVRLLEQGRGVIFRQLTQLREEVDDIRVMVPSLADEFNELSFYLEQLAVRSSQITSSKAPDSSKVSSVEPLPEKANNAPKTKTSIPAMTQRSTSEEDRMESLYKSFSSSWLAVVSKIRGVYGFSHFLQPASFFELQWAAEAGPVIVVNISNLRSDAIIISRQGPPLAVPLPSATPRDIAKLAKHFEGKPGALAEPIALGVLRGIWEAIVQPIAEALRGPDLNRPFGSRIWWCPTGLAARLPLHAAGPYKQGQRDMTHMYTSSYTPTLGALILARRHHVTRAKDWERFPKTLVVSQQGEGKLQLRNAQAEAEFVKGLFTESNCTLLQGPEATHRAVLREIPNHHWLHLVCHGHRDSTQPLASRFSMCDKPISLLDLIKQELPKAELAVLSACHSAGVDEGTPDESLHPAAAMLFTGFRSVVATMWALDDTVGPRVAKLFYKQMLDDEGGMKDATEAASALRTTIQKLGDENVSLMERINLVHFGI